MYVFILSIYFTIALVMYIILYCWACHTWKKNKIENCCTEDFKSWYDDEYEYVFIASSFCWPLTFVLGIIHYLYEYVTKLIRKIYGI